MMTDKNALIEQYMPLANKLAIGRKKTLPRHIEFEELQSAAYLGLVKAAAKFDVSKKVEFITYAWAYISGSINDYLRSLGFVKHLSLDISKDEEGPLKDLIESEVDGNSFDDVLEVVTNNLEDQAGMILRSYFAKDFSLEDVGAEIGLSKGRVCQLISSYKEQIRNRWTKEELLEELAA